jgi:uncharacterized protein
MEPRRDCLRRSSVRGLLSTFNHTRNVGALEFALGFAHGASMITFHGCTALITGASSGFGAEFARQLAPYARTLILVARGREALDALAVELARPGLEVRVEAADLLSASDTENLLANVAGAKVDLLINNAGIGDHGLFEKSDWARVKAMIDLNVTALSRLTHGLLPSMITAKNGRVLNVSSIAGDIPVPCMAVYAATKSYVTSLTEALRCELRGTGVTVCAVCPGPVDTGFAAKAARAGEHDEMVSPPIMKVTSAKVVREGLLALERGRARVVPGWVPAAVAVAISVVPMFALRAFLRRRR